MCICFKHLSMMWNVNQFLGCVILINFHMRHSCRWPKCRTSQGICQGSWAYCLTELWSCSEHAGIWTIREIIWGKPLKIPNYKINCTQDHLSFWRNDWQWCFLYSTSSCKLLYCKCDPSCVCHFYGYRRDPMGIMKVGEMH